MLDRFSRNETAQALRHFASGQITNDDMEWRIPGSSDRSVSAIHGYAWLLFDDLNEHKAKGKHVLDKANKQTVARCVLFLRSEETYTYPPFTFLKELDFKTFAKALLNIFTFGMFLKLLPEYDDFENHGDTSVWPFENKEQLERVVLESSLKNKALL